MGSALLAYRRMIRSGRTLLRSYCSTRANTAHEAANACLPAFPQASSLSVLLRCKSTCHLRILLHAPILYASTPFSTALCTSSMPALFCVVHLVYADTILHCTAPCRATCAHQRLPCCSSSPSGTAKPSVPHRAYSWRHIVSRLCACHSHANVCLCTHHTCQQCCHIPPSMFPWTLCHTCAGGLVRSTIPTWVGSCHACNRLFVF